jgi:Dyp-type peroxidase family
MTTSLEHKIDKSRRETEENRLKEERRKQPGIAFPSASVQEHLLIIRLDLALPARGKKESPELINIVRNGLNRLGDLFERIENGNKKIDELLKTGDLVRSSLSKFYFSSTIGFGTGFFEKLEIASHKRPKKLREMPDHLSLGDVTPYRLSQTDLIIQLGATKDFVNRWVLENNVEPTTGHRRKKSEDGFFEEVNSYARQEVRNGSPDIVSAIRGWATITDVHSGFQRIDGRNLMGFNDGVSNPGRLSPLFNEIVWTSIYDEQNADLADGTYMVFQKIEHDLDQWRELNVEKQQEWIGRSKGTGLVLGTLPQEDDRRLACDLKSMDETIRNDAMRRWKELFDEQRDPELQIFDNGNTRFKDIPLKCPVWSHVRKANPRQADHVPKKIIFRRGYPYIESGLDGRISSGLLFVCFQKDVGNGFEFIKKMWLNNKSFPVPNVRPFNLDELAKRHLRGRFSANELSGLSLDQRRAFGLDDYDRFEEAIKEAKSYELTSCSETMPEQESDCDVQNTGREGLAGPSELGVNPTGEFLAIVPIGGGYYFIPPILNQSFAEIGQQFFE